jgi:hypothetical protein
VWKGVVIKFLFGSAHDELEGKREEDKRRMHHGSTKENQTVAERVETHEEKESKGKNNINVWSGSN